MAQGVINEIVAPEALAQLDALADGLSAADESMTHLIGTATSLNSALKGATSIAQISNGIQAATENSIGLVDAQNRLISTTKQISDETSAYGVNMGESLQHYVNLKIQINENTSAIRERRKALSDDTAAMKQYGDAIDQLSGKKFSVLIQESNDAIRENIANNALLAREVVKANEVITGAVDKRVAKEIASQDKLIAKKLAAQQKMVEAEDARIEKENQLELEGQLKKLEQQQKADERRISQIQAQAERENALIDAQIQYAIEKDAIRTQAQYKEGERRALAMEREIEASRIAQEKALPENRILSQQGSRNDMLSAKLGLAKPGSYDAMSAELSQLKISLHGLTEEELLNDAATQKMVARHNELDGALKRIDKSLGTSSRSVGDYGSALNETGSLIESIGGKIQTFIVRDLLRAAAGFVVFTLLFEGVQKLYEAFTKLSEEEQTAADNMKKFEDNVKSLQDTMSGLSDKINVNIDIEQNKSQLLIDTYNNAKTSITGKINTYMELQGLYPKILDSLTDEEKKTKSVTAAHEQQMTVLKQYISLKNNISGADEGIAANSKVIESGNSQMNDIAATMSPETKRATGRAINAQQNSKVHPTVEDAAEGVDEAKANKYLDIRDKVRASENAIAILKKAQLDDAIKMANLENNPKTKKDKKETEKSKYQAELAEEEATYKLVLAKNKERFENSERTTQDETQLNDENEVANHSHGLRMIEIITKWHNAIKEDNAKFIADKTKAQAEEVNGDAKYIEEQKRIHEEERKARAEDVAELDGYIAKLLEQKAKIEEMQRNTATAAKHQSAHHDFATGGKAFFGEEDTTQSDIADKISNAQASRGGIQTMLNNANQSGNQNDAEKYANDLKKVDDEIANYQIESEKDKDDKLIAYKKEVAAQTIELAQQTMESIKTIQDNQFAHEQQQLEIQMQRVTLAAQQKEQAINATTQFQVTKSNQLSLLAAQTKAEQDSIQQKENQLAVKKARADRTAAEAGIILNTALSITKIWAAYGAIPAEAAILTAVATAVGAAQFAAAASAPIPQYRYGTPSTTTPLFIAGEAGENEWIQNPSGEGKWSGTSAKLFHEPLGTSVTPISKIRDFANSHVAPKYDVTMSAGNMAQEITDGINKVAAEIGGNIVYAIMRNSSNGGNKDNSFLESAYFNSKLQSKG